MEKLNKHINWVILYTLSFFILWPLLPVAQQSNSSKTFKAGAALSNITPFLGGGIVGNFGEPPAAKYVHDELHARSLVLDDGSNKLAFVICDNIGIARHVCDAAKQQIQARTQIPVQNILIAGTHTHSATSAEGEGLRRRGWNKDRPLDEYQQFLAHRIADAVEMAIHNLQPAEIGWSSVHIPEHVFNRRWYLKKPAINPFGVMEQVKMNPGVGNPDLDKPAGPTDPELSFISIQSTSGEPIALLANYSLHYIGGVPMHDISADYFAVFANKMKSILQQKGQTVPFIGIMSNGTSGDINNIDVKATGSKFKPYEKMELVANDIADKVFKAQQQIRYQPWVKLQAQQADLTLQIRKPDQQLSAWAKRVLALPEGSKPLNHSLEKTYAERVTQLANEWPNEIAVPIQAFRIGDLQIGAIPFETFAETGLHLKQNPAASKTFTISFANGSYGYLPPPEQHALGGYETWLGTNRVEKEASRKIVALLEKQFKAMSQQAK